MMRGKSNPEIGIILGASARTIEKQMTARSSTSVKADAARPARR
jgi:hypothetical protein